MNINVALEKEAGMLSNLYHAVFSLCFMGNRLCHLRGLLLLAGKRGSKTLKGAAVKISQPTRLPFGAFFPWSV
jgi:hypothetical protein